ncbi:MAG: hypothetical protein IIC35_06455 [Gemmatimonadetes bacterium]|nr:hypothetical protein [Gemmatimonadota bacterium]
MRCALGVLMTMGRFCAVALVLATSLGAQSRIRTDVDTTLVTVGDRITLTVSVQHAVGTSVVWPDSVSLGSFEVLAARALPTQADGDGSRSVAVFSLAAFELGALEIPSFDVTVVASDGSSETLSTDRYGIEVVTVGADETGDIREIRGPLGIPLSTVVVALWGLVILIVGALAYMLFRRFRRSGPVADEPAPGPPPRPAHEIALEALVRIESVEGKANVIRGDDIDTDRIIPARFMKVVTFDDMGRHAFEDARKAAKVPPRLVFSPIYPADRV